MKDKKYIYQFSNHTIEEFACYLCPALKNVNCAVSGYSGYSGFSGYSGYSGRSGYSGYSGFSGYSGYSGYSGQDGAACAVQEITVSQGQALISNSQVDPCGLYLITDAYNDTCQIYIRGLNANTFDEQGFGTFTNTATPGGVVAMMKYTISVDKVTEVYIPTRNVRVTQSYDPVGAVSGGNSIDKYPFAGNALSPETNVDIRDCIFNGTVNNNNILFSNSIVSNCTFNFNANDSQITNCRMFQAAITLNAINTSIIGSDIFGATVTLGSGTCSLVESTLHEDSTLVLNLGSSANKLYMGAGSTVNLLDNNDFLRVNVGQAKVVNPPANYNATSASIEDLDSTFEVFINPDVTGVLDMINYRFGGIVRIGTTGVPASWDLKQITNFPTSHIFCIVPADSNLVDVYDAGAGGNNIYLSTTAVVTYDGDKDDTLVVRSGLNSSSRLFQIGGWQAPSA